MLILAADSVPCKMRSAYGSSSSGEMPREGVSARRGVGDLRFSREIYPNRAGPGASLIDPLLLLDDGPAVNATSTEPPSKSK